MKTFIKSIPFIFVLATTANADPVTDVIDQLTAQGYTHFSVSRGTFRTQITGFGTDGKIEVKLNSNGNVVRSKTEPMNQDQVAREQNEISRRHNEDGHDNDQVGAENSEVGGSDGDANHSESGSHSECKGDRDGDTNHSEAVDDTNSSSGGSDHDDGPDHGEAGNDSGSDYSEGDHDGGSDRSGGDHDGGDRDHD